MDSSPENYGELQRAIGAPPAYLETLFLSLHGRLSERDWQGETDIDQRWRETEGRGDEERREQVKVDRDADGED